MAVATAYFLALNALATYLFLQLIRTRDEMRDMRQELDGLRPRMEDMANVARVSLRGASENLKSRAVEQEPGGQ